MPTATLPLKTDPVPIVKKDGSVLRVDLGGSEKCHCHRSSKARRSAPTVSLYQPLQKYSVGQNSGLCGVTFRFVICASTKPRRLNQSVGLRLNLLTARKDLTR
jgi:hypothetical protein